MHINFSDADSLSQIRIPIDFKQKIDEKDTLDSSLLISSLYMSFVMVSEPSWELSPELIKKIFPVDPNTNPSRTVSRFNFFTTIYNIFNTATGWLYETKNPDYETISFPQVWQMFNSVIVHHYINQLTGKVNFNFIENFLLVKPEINLCSLKNICACLDSDILSPVSKPICIPIVLAAKQHFSRNHIVALLIKDGTIEYFDSMGIRSDQIILGNHSETLRNVLEHLQAKLGFQIVEHEMKLQTDFHNCGVFVCEFYRQRLACGTTPGAKPEALSNDELLLARENIFSAIFPTMKAEAEVNLKTDAEPPLYDEFDSVFDDLLK